MRCIVIGLWTACLGPLFPNQRVEFSYVIAFIDLYSRWPVAYRLRSLAAKHVCDALLQLFMQTGIASSLNIFINYIRVIYLPSLLQNS